jgi:hypothetical protein
MPVAAGEKLSLHTTVSHRRWATFAKDFNPTPDVPENFEKLIAARAAST